MARRRSGLGTAADDRWLELADELALAAATGDASYSVRPDFRVEAFAGAEECRLGLAPFPLAGSTRIELSCRRLPSAAAGSDLDLARALALARWERRPVRVVPLA